MRPRFRILDKTFKTRAKDRTQLKAVHKDKLRNPVVQSQKEYQFKYLELVDEPKEDSGSWVVQKTTGFFDDAITVTATNSYEIHDDTTPTSTEPVRIWSPYRVAVSEATTGATW